MDKSTFHMLSYGLYIVSAAADGKVNGQVANTVFQLTSEPPRFGVGINKGNLTHSFIQKSKAMAVSILPQDASMSLIGLFGFKSGRDVNKFENITFKTGMTGSPILLESSLGYIETKVINEVDVGTHTLFICEAVEAETLREGEPLTYAYYHTMKKGSTPPSAPTYIPSNGAKSAEKGTDRMRRYVCSVCGYVYDPAAGDPEGGAVPGTPFAELPDGWICPVCGAAKNAFEPEE